MESAETAVAKERSCKRHVTTATITYTKIEELLEAVFSMPSAARSASHYTKTTATNVAFSAVRAKAI
jgi:hypothetical protein